MQKRNRFIILLIVSILVTGLVFVGGNSALAAKVKVVYMTAGDVNMLALGQNVVGPQFSKKYPD
ncbi:MAG: hypothetical protein PVG15_17665, partial [Desulfobacterales bacterium]